MTIGNMNLRHRGNKTHVGFLPSKGAFHRFYETDKLRQQVLKQKITMGMKFFVLYNNPGPRGFEIIGIWKAKWQTDDSPVHIEDHTMEKR